jgi:hypothetical protein
MGSWWTSPMNENSIFVLDSYNRFSPGISLALFHFQNSAAFCFLLLRCLLPFQKYVPVFLLSPLTPFRSYRLLYMDFRFLLVALLPMDPFIALFILSLFFISVPTAKS